MNKLCPCNSFDECYKEKCAWWFVDSCSIQAIVFIFGHIFLKKKKEVD